MFDLETIYLPIKFGTKIYNSGRLYTMTARRQIRYVRGNFYFMDNAWGL